MLTLDDGHEVGVFKVSTLGQSVDVVHIFGVMLVVVDLDSALANMRLKGIVGIRKSWQSDGHFKISNDFEEIPGILIKGVDRSSIELSANKRFIE